MVDAIAALEHIQAAAAAAQEGLEVEREQEDAQAQERPEEAAPPLACTSQSMSMELTEEEREWAQNIKDAIEEEGTGNLDVPPNDYWYAQLALVDKDNVAAALDRVFKLQQFRQDYDILDTVTQGQQVVEAYMELWPEFYLYLNHNGSVGHHYFTIVFDFTKFHKSVLQEKPQAYKIWFQAIYYINQALCSDLEATRQGTVFLLECQGFDWKKNFGLDVMRPYWSDIAGVYPLNHKMIKYYHTGVFLNTLVSMAKKFMPVAAQDKFQVGCVCDLGQTLSQLYLTPNVQEADQRFRERFRVGLEKRYVNEASFQL